MGSEFSETRWAAEKDLLKKAKDATDNFKKGEQNRAAEKFSQLRKEFPDEIRKAADRGRRIIMYKVHPLAADYNEQEIALGLLESFAKDLGFATKTRRIGGELHLTCSW